MKIISWNKGQSNILDYMTEIKELIRLEKPSVLFINELYLNQSQHRGLIHINGYKYLYACLVANAYICKHVLL